MARIPLISVSGKKARDSHIANRRGGKGSSGGGKGGANCGTGGGGGECSGDGDGMVGGIVVGERPKPEEEEPQEQGGWLSGITNTIESATGLDIDGDGTAGGQKPKQPWQPKQTKSFVSYAAWPKGEPRFVSYGSGAAAAKPQPSQNWLAWLM